MELTGVRGLGEGGGGGGGLAMLLLQLGLSWLAAVRPAQAGAGLLFTTHAYFLNL